MSQKTRWTGNIRIICPLATAVIYCQLYIWNSGLAFFRQNFRISVLDKVNHPIHALPLSIFIERPAHVAAKARAMDRKVKAMLFRHR